MTIAECVSEFEYLLGKAGSGKLSFALGSGTKFSAVCLDDVMEDIVRKYGSYCDNNDDYMDYLEKKAFICYPGVCQTLVTVPFRCHFFVVDLMSIGNHQFRPVVFNTANSYLSLVYTYFRCADCSIVLCLQEQSMTREARLKIRPIFFVHTTLITTNLHQSPIFRAVQDICYIK